MKHTSAARSAAQLGLPKSRGMEAVLKAQLIAAVSREVELQQLTHAEVASRAGIARTAVTGILSGSMQKVTIDRVLRTVRRRYGDVSATALRSLKPAPTGPL